jgi:anti-anti-sigma regulatory factor
MLNAGSSNFVVSKKEKRKSAMTNAVSITVKRFPEPCDKAAGKVFLREIRELVARSHRPRLIVDLSEVNQISPEAIDLLLKCAGYSESNDGELSVAGASPRTAVMLELTQANSVLNIFNSVVEATAGREFSEFDPEERYPQTNAA